MLIILLIMFMCFNALKLFHQPFVVDTKQLFIVALTTLIVGDLIKECLENGLVRKVKEKLRKDKFNALDMRMELLSHPLVWLFSLLYYVLIAGVLYEVYILITRLQVNLAHIGLLAMFFIILDIVFFLYFFHFLNKKFISAIGLMLYYEAQLLVSVSAIVCTVALAIMCVTVAIVVAIIFLIALFVDF